MNLLTNKTIIVTGASKGIGAAIAISLAKQDANVIINYNSDEKGAYQIAHQITSFNGKATCVKANVTKASEVAFLFKKTIETYGTIDTLINNAGVYQFEPIETVTQEEFHRQFNNNVLSIILTTQEALKYFSKSGNIINISSIASVKATPMTMLYTATKSAVDGITRTLSKELGNKNIRVNAILPGPTVTEGNPIQNTEMEQFIANETPLGRIGLPSDVASLAVFLSSDESKWITGQKIGVSGGFD